MKMELREFLVFSPVNDQSVAFLLQVKIIDQPAYREKQVRQ